MSGNRKRHISYESSQFEDGLAILASMLADMLIGAEKDGPGETTDSLETEVEEKQSPRPLGPSQS